MSGARGVAAALANNVRPSRIRAIIADTSAASCATPGSEPVLRSEKNQLRENQKQDEELSRLDDEQAEVHGLHITPQHASVEGVLSSLEDSLSAGRRASVLSVAAEYKQLLSVRGSPQIMPILSILLTLTSRPRRRSMISSSGCS